MTHMHRLVVTPELARVALAALLGLGVSTATEARPPVVPPPPQQLQLTGVIRDFNAWGSAGGHITMERPDMPSGLGSRWVIGNLVSPDLGADNKPVFTNSGIIVKSPWVDAAGNNIAMQLAPMPGDVSGQLTGAWNDYLDTSSFSDLFHDVPGVNMSAPLTLTFNRQANGTYVFDADAQMPGGFFPIDGTLLGNQGRSHNYHFSFELHTKFLYVAANNPTFRFTGDDDCWVFINDKLVVDLGGRHSAKSMYVALNRLGLANGVTYPLDFFIMERKTSGSHCLITTELQLQEAATVSISAAFD